MNIPGWLTGYAASPRGTTEAPNLAYTPPGRWAVYCSRLRGYMDRWIVLTPWGTLRLHHILRADIGDDPHDHPFDFASLILCGGYTEARRFNDVDQVCRFDAGDIVRRKTTDFHRLISVDPGTWTLVLSGPKVKPWGFKMPDGSFVSHLEYRVSRTDGP